ncbi:MAG TPA: histidine kinase [Burkholderiaceae bacterium]|jgi:hypothetical protein|nr:histidine kinase [Burkholderiaceae bacterium]
MITQTFTVGVKPTPSDAVSANSYWWCQIIGWGTYNGMVLLAQLTSRPKTESLSHFLGTIALISLFSMAIGIFLSQRWRLTIRRHGWIERTGGLPLMQFAMGILLLAMLQLFLNFLTYYLIRPTTADELSEWAKYDLLWTALAWVSIYLVWTVLYVATVSRRHTRRMEIEKLQLELHVKEAELRALQAQVNPHFFFNSLNSIRALIYEDAQSAADVIDRLASMMRYTLQSGRANTVPLAQEMQAVRDYLSIEKIRFEDRLQVTESIDMQLDHMAFPPMALQTLVENAVKYGVELSMTPCELRISSQRDGDQIQLAVSNQGRLQEATGSTKIGVRNASKRMALIFGDGAGVDLFERDGWVTARLNFPCLPMGVQ